MENVQSEFTDILYKDGSVESVEVFSADHLRAENLLRAKGLPVTDAAYEYIAYRTWAALKRGHSPRVESVDFKTWHDSVKRLKYRESETDLDPTIPPDPWDEPSPS
jgi:hypothetical protein